MPVPRSAAPAGLKAVDHSCILRRRVKTSLERPDRDARIARRPGVPAKSRILMAGHSLAVYDERDFAGCFSRGAVAQLGERRVRNAKVEGSIPFRSTIKFQGFRRSLAGRSEEHTSELQSQFHLVCRLLLEKKKKKKQII